jgi:molecular chaperone Hsp33
MKNRLITTLSKNKEVRLYMIDSTEMVEAARRTYSMSPVAIAALGRTITAASLIGKTLKNNKDQLTLQIKGSGEIKTIIAVAKPNGQVKGYISSPYVETQINKKGKLDVGGAVGKEGDLYLIRDYGMKEPYIGHSKLISGEIAEDLASYFMHSEQQPTVFSLGVFVNGEGIVTAAGGLFIQPLPDASDETLVKIEEAMATLPAISTLIQEEKHLSLENIIKKHFSSLDFKVTDQIDTGLYCDCSKERMQEALVSLGTDELNEMINEDDGAEIHCHFCNTNYKFTADELREIIKN